MKEWKESSLKAVAKFLEKNVGRVDLEIAMTEMYFYSESNVCNVECFDEDCNYIFEMVVSFDDATVMISTRKGVTYERTFKTLVELKKIAIEMVNGMFDEYDYSLRIAERSTEEVTEHSTEEVTEQPTEEITEQEVSEQPTGEVAICELYTDTDIDGTKSTWEETNKRLSEKYGEDYCIGNFYPDIPNVNPHLVNALHYRGEVYKYQQYYKNPNRYAKPRWAKKLTPSNEKLTIYRAFKQMVKDAYLYKNTLDRLFTVHSYLMKLHQKGKITTLDYYFYTNKLENMYNECLR